MAGISLQLGDITTARVDAIVNAANPAMLGGGGVDGAIHRAAGPALLEACRAVPAIDGIRCPIGQARITGAGRLHARHVIHAVGPRYHIDPQPQALLAGAYRSALELALQYDCQRLALPAISCGVYAYPVPEAATIALSVCREPRFAALHLAFYLFAQDVYDAFAAALDNKDNTP